MRLLVVPARARHASLGCAWKLVGDNNRALGRSPVVHGSAADCEDDVRALAAALDAAAAGVEVRVERRDSLWRWALQVEGVDRAAAARGYPSQREALASAARFVSDLPVAVG